MARTTEDLVVALLANNYDSNVSLAAPLVAAYVLVNRIVAKDTDSLLGSSDDPGVDDPDGDREILERFIAAHFYLAGPDPAFKSSQDGRANATIQGMDGKGFDSTFYGQTAKNLDPTGTLKAFDNKGQIRMVWLGTDDC